MSKEKLIEIINKSVFNMCFGDVKRASIDGNAKMAGFILGACFIDTLAGYYAGIDKENYKQNSGKRFKEFVKKYLKKYDEEKLYSDLRCGLVHSYTQNDGTYSFTDDNKAGKHFEVMRTGRIMLNLEDFIADLENAYNLFVNDIKTDDKVFQNARKRLLSLKTMGVHKVGSMQL